MHVKTRLLIISDTHSASPTQNESKTDVAFRTPLPTADVLLHCGDLTMMGYPHEYQKTLEMLGDIDADLKLVIAGNHDISLDEEYYARRGEFMHSRLGYDKDLPARVKEMWTGDLATRAGITYLEEGTYTFTLKNGAELRVYSSPYQPEFCDWAFPTFPHQDRYNPPHLCTSGAVSIAKHPIPDFPAIDVMMTHGPPKGVLDTTRRGETAGCPHLLQAAQRCKPRLHCFGHIHEGWGAQRIRWRELGQQEPNAENLVGTVTDVDVDHEKMVEEHAAAVDATDIVFGQETLIINASIMTYTYRPWNGAWLVDLNLEKAY